LGFGLAAVAAVGAGIAALWSLLGIYLGRWFERDDPKSIVDATSASRESSKNEA